jgi:hypothetical protein
MVNRSDRRVIADTNMRIRRNLDLSIIDTKSTAQIERTLRTCCITFNTVSRGKVIILVRIACTVW